MLTKREALAASTKYFGGDEMAASNFVGKYALRDGDDYLELTPDAMHDRLAAEFHRIEQNYPNSLGYDTIRASLDHFKKLVPQGSPMFGVGNHIDTVSLSNCFVVESPEDTLSSIHDRGRDLANLFKRRAGVGIDISTLRPEGSPVRNSAKTSSGAWNFANFYSEVCRSTGQNGRRGALMITLDVSHPDIKKFVTMKVDRTKVTGANVSVMLTDAFMQAVDEDAQWPLQFNGKEYEQVSARDLWHLICTTATETAEPGLIFIDNYRRNLPLDFYPGFKSVCVNPCAEILLAPNDACRLLVVNFMGFVENPYKESAWFNQEDYVNHIHIAMRLMDDLVDLEIEALQKIIDQADTLDEQELFTRALETAQAGRRTGLGTTGLADAMAALGKRYDDPDERGWIAERFEELRNHAYEESVAMAVERGAFPAFDWETEKDCEFFTRFPETLRESMRILGRRNGALLTNAPTGTVSTVTQTSSGIEPIIFLRYDRWRKINAGEDELSVHRTDIVGDKWHRFEVLHHGVAAYLKANNLPPDASLPDYFVTAADIDWVERVKIQGTIQENIDHGISSTINLPRGTPVETVKTLYEKAHKCGLKGVTVYVDGCREAVMEQASINKNEWFIRPTELKCAIYHQAVKVGDDTTNYVIFVGHKDGRPFEVFGGDAVELPAVGDCCTEGVIVKRKQDKCNSYDLIIDGVALAPLGTMFKTGDHATINRLISVMMRKQIDVKYIVDQLTKESSGGSMLDYNRVLARVLKRYIKEGEESTNKCPSCGSKMLVYSEGCNKCLDCGFSGCT